MHSKSNSSLATIPLASKFIRGPFLQHVPFQAITFTVISSHVTASRGLISGTIVYNNPLNVARPPKSGITQYGAVSIIFHF
jgi:hypothetical protein